MGRSVVVTNGGCLNDRGATLSIEAGGPVPLINDMSITQAAAFQAITKSLQILNKPEYAHRPALIRPLKQIARIVAGLDRDMIHHHHVIMKAWKQTAETRHNRLWLTCASPRSNNTWADRAFTIAHLGHLGTLGAVGNRPPPDRFP